MERLSAVVSDRIGIHGCESGIPSVSQIAAIHRLSNGSFRRSPDMGTGQQEAHVENKRHDPETESARMVAFDSETMFREPNGPWSPFDQCWGERKNGLLKSWTRWATLIALAVVVSACGETPLESIGERSSGWINEPELVTTTLAPTTVPVVSDSSVLQWANEDIVNLNLDDPTALVASIFQRRQGDRFIQASRNEIAAALPGVRFPAVVPYGVGWVSSQLVIENSGDLSSDPTAAFGFWTAEPYTRSRSVAQLVTLVVSNDADGAAQAAEGAEGLSCAALADQTTLQCDIIELPGRKVWRLGSAAGETFIWFDDVRRYELFGRLFVPDDALTRMVTQLMALEDLEPVTS